MSPIEQAKALAAYWRNEADDMDGCYGPDFGSLHEDAAKARETADLLEKLAAELERP